jgi:hypothetical protein
VDRAADANDWCASERDINADGFALRHSALGHNMPVKYLCPNKTRNEIRTAGKKTEEEKNIHVVFSRAATSMKSRRDQLVLKN